MHRCRADRRADYCADRRAVTVFDVIVVTALLLATAIVVVPTLSARTREAENRVKCASNLRQIGLAMRMYANQETRTFTYPKTVRDAETADKPVSFTHPEAPNPFQPGGPDANDVTAPLWLLLRTQDITPDVFVCASAQTQPFAYPHGKRANDFSNFASAASLSYSVENQYPTQAAIERGFVWNDSMSADAPLMADMNPGVPALLTIKKTDPIDQQRKVNSPNHGYQGQNVLYADGHVDWAATVWAGVQTNNNGVLRDDNIYAYRTPDGNDLPETSAGIIGPPGGPEDAILLPKWDEKIKIPTIDFAAPGGEPERPTPAVAR